MKKQIRFMPLALALTLGYTLSTNAESYSWNGAEGDSWSNGSCWLPAGVPGASDTAAFAASATVALPADATVSAIEVSGNARVHLTGNGTKIAARAFSGNGTIALDGTRLQGMSDSASTWSDGCEIPATLGIEIVKNRVESRILASGDKRRLVVSGPLTGDGTVRIGYSTSGIGGVKLCGDNSGFRGKLIVDGASAARNQFGASQSGGESMSLELAGNTSDNGSMAFAESTLKFGSIVTTSRTTQNYAWRFNNSGTVVLEVGHLNSSDDRISIHLGENNSATGKAKIRKVGSGTLELWNPGHRLGTEIDGGTLLVTSDKALNLYANADITFGHDANAPGGVLKYGTNEWEDDGTKREMPVDVTTDYSALIKNSLAPVAIDTDGKQVTFSTALDPSNVGGILKLGAGTLSLARPQALLSPVAVSNGTLHAFVNANPTGRIDIAEGGVLEIYGTGRNLENAAVHGAGTLRFIQESDKYRSFRLNSTADFSDFAGTLEFYGTNELTAADGLINRDYENHLENTTLVIAGEPTEPRRLFDIEHRVTTVGALRILNENIKIRLSNNPTVNFGDKAVSESILNGKFFNAAGTLVKNGNTPLTVCNGFEMLAGGELRVNEASVLNVNADLTQADYTVTIASGVPLSGTGKVTAAQFAAANAYAVSAVNDGALLVSGSVALASAAFTLDLSDIDPSKSYTLLTADAITSLPPASLLSGINATDKKGKWSFAARSNGNGMSLVLKWAPKGTVLVFR